MEVRTSGVDIANSDVDRGGCAAGCDTVAVELFRLAGHPVRRCPECGLYMLEPGPQWSPAEELERGEFEDAFVALRARNYAAILEQLPRRGRLLDVGCSSGWFLRQAGEAGFECHGIEPDEFFLERARSRVPGTPLVHGSFDRDLPEDWSGFDVITFHDVFEHLPQPRAVLAACARRLRPGGLVVLSLPSAAGFVFWLGGWLNRCGWPGALERMFQVHYPYPHWFYFDAGSIRALAAHSGFEVVRRIPLRSFSLQGAHHRANMDRAGGWSGRARNLLATGALLSFALLQYLLPADNVAFLLKPRES